MKKAIAGQVLLAVLAFATAASANQFYIEKPGTKHGERVRLKPGVIAEVPVEGRWLLRLKAPGKKQPLIKVPCVDTRTDALRNSKTVAFDEVTALTFVACPEGVTITPFTPWHGILEGGGEPFSEPFKDIVIEVTTPERSWGIFTGRMTAIFGDGDPIPHDDIDNEFKLNTKSGTLLNAEGATLQLSVQDEYGTKSVNRADGERNGEPKENGGSTGDDDD